MCSKYPPFSLTQVWIPASHPRQSVIVQEALPTVLPHSRADNLTISDCC